MIAIEQFFQYDFKEKIKRKGDDYSLDLDYRVDLKESKFSLNLFVVWNSSNNHRVVSSAVQDPMNECYSSNLELPNASLTIIN